MIPSATYYRMSTDDQTDSIPAQKTAVKHLAKAGGYKIVAEYKDEGISGDDTEKRKDFRRMIADAEAGKFKAILCWDQDRFGRFDSIEAGRWIYPLRQAGVKLVTVAQGVIDWSDFASRMMYGIQQEAKHQYLLDLSRNVLRGMARQAQDGKWACGKSPLGYVVGTDGKLALGNPSEVALVRHIFACYLDGASLRTLVEHLNSRGYKTRTGRAFEYVGVRFILKNRNYLGDLHFNVRSDSKYSSIRGGQVGAPTVERHTSPANWIVVPKSHPRIIDEQTFDAVQERLKSNRHRSTPRPNGGGFVLSGLLRCAKCGGAMTGATYGSLLYYVCTSYYHRGAAHCDRNAVRQDELLGSIVGAIDQHFVNPKTIKKLREAVRQEIEQELMAPPKDLDKQLSQVRRDLKTAERNMALASTEDLRRRCESVVADLVEREAALMIQSADAAIPKRRRLDGANDRIKDAVAVFSRLRQVVQHDEPPVVREALREAIVGVEVKVRYEQRRQRKRFFLEGLDIETTLNLLGIDRPCNQVIRFRAVA